MQFALLNSFYCFVSLSPPPPPQEPVEILGPVEIHANRIESLNGVLPTYTRI